MFATLIALVASAAASSPFVIEDVTLSPGTASALATKVIRNTATGELLQIAHGSGGKTLRLKLGIQGALRDVLVPLTSASEIRETADGIHYAGSILAPFANRVANGSYDFYGTRHYLPRNECPKDVRCDALHGFLFNRTLDVVATRTDPCNLPPRHNLTKSVTCVASVTLGYKFDGTSTPGWPFKADVNVSYVLSTTAEVQDGLVVRRRPGKLDIYIQAKNTNADGMALPWTSSWHPYIQVSDVSKARVEFAHYCDWQHLSVPAGAPRNGSLIPTGKTTAWTQFDGKTPIGGTTTKPTYMDDEFKAVNCDFNRTTHLNYIHDDGGNATIVMASPIRPGPYVWRQHGVPESPAWQIFTGAKEGWGWDAIALEPMSGLADAFNNGDGLTVIAAGQTIEHQFSLAYEYRGEAE